MYNDGVRSFTTDSVIYLFVYSFVCLRVVYARANMQFSIRLGYSSYFFLIMHTTIYIAMQAWTFKTQVIFIVILFLISIGFVFVFFFLYLVCLLTLVRGRFGLAVFLVGVNVCFTSYCLTLAHSNQPIVGHAKRLVCERCHRIVTMRYKSIVIKNLWYLPFFSRFSPSNRENMCFCETMTPRDGNRIE